MLIRSVTLPSLEMLGGCGVLRMAAAGVGLWGRWRDLHLSLASIERGDDDGVAGLDRQAGGPWKLRACAWGIGCGK